LPYTVYSHFLDNLFLEMLRCSFSRRWL